MAPTMIRRIFEAREMGWFRHQMALIQASRDLRGTVMMSERLGFATLDGSDLGLMRAQGSVLFILGSGETVEELTPQQWNLVSQNVSVGINSWAVHDFVPDAYSFEEVESESYSDVSSTLSLLLARREVIVRRPRILMLRPHALTSSSRIVSVPDELRAEVRLYGRTAVVTRDINNLGSDIGRVLRAMLSSNIHPGISLDAGMSVSRLITLGARAGFGTIVLVGIDLNSPRYFFDVNPGYWERRAVAPFDQWRNRGLVHDTEETVTRSFRATEFIPALAGATWSVFGTRVFISSENSALSPFLPVFRWNNERDLV
jgi:hypothetical protein